MRTRTKFNVLVEVVLHLVASKVLRCLVVIDVLDTSVLVTVVEDLDAPWLVGHLADRS